LVLQEFDEDDAEGVVGEIARDVSEVAGGEACVSISQLEGDGIFALDRVGDVGGAERDVSVVVAVPVHQRVGVRRDFGVEDADLIVGEDEVVVRLGGDFDFLRRLGEEEKGEKEQQTSFHAQRF
jgi:hypothetical protein